MLTAVWLKFCSDLRKGLSTFYNHFFFFFLSRAWNQLYCVLSNGKLLFFKDQNTAAKAAQTGGGQYSGRLTYKSETPLDLAGCQCTVATDYAWGFLQNVCTRKSPEIGLIRRLLRKPSVLDQKNQRVQTQVIQRRWISNSSS